MTATKIQPGDDTHLTLLMTPHSLNFVTGADRAALLAYGRDVFAAARDSKCLAQIEEPAAVAGPADELAELAMLNKLIELGAKASYAHAKSNSDDGPAGTAAYVQWQELRAEMGELIRAHVAPALEAPAAPAVPVGFALVPIEPTQQMLDAGRWSGAGSVSIQEEWARKEVWSRMLATVAPPPAAYADDLVALVVNLVQALSAVAPDNDLASHALDYLKRNGLQGSPLQAAEAAPQAPAAPVAAPEAARLLSDIEDWLNDLRQANFDGYVPQNVFSEAGDFVERIEALPDTAAAPAAPAVDASFEDLISDWAHGDALDAEYYRTLSQAARDVLAERRRQVCAEGYEPEADAMYESGELARAAATYALLATGDDGWRVEDNWPWGMSTLKRAEPRRMLEKAGALILADMERIDRAAAAKKGGEV